MDFSCLFRKSLFGGYNKKDVEEYLDGLAKEMKNWKQEKETPSDKEIEKAKEEISQLKEELSRTRTELQEKEEKLQYGEKDGEIFAELQLKKDEIVRLREELQRVRAISPDLQAKEDEIANLQKELKEAHSEMLELTIERADDGDIFQPQEAAGLREENERLHQKIKQLEEDYKDVMAERNLISRVLHDARGKADQILEDANMQAKITMENADKEAGRIIEAAAEEADSNVEQANRELEEKRRIIFGEFRKEIEARMIDFITVKYKIADYVKDINLMQMELGKISQSMQSLSYEMPAKVNNILENVEEDIALPEMEQRKNVKSVESMNE